MRQKNLRAIDPNLCQEFLHADPVRLSELVAQVVVAHAQEQSGGAFVEQCTHLADLARWVAGDMTNVSAYSARGFVEGEEKHIDAEKNIFEIQNNTFLDAAKAKDTSLIRTLYADAIETLRVTLAANESIRTGKALTIGHCCPR